MKSFKEFGEYIKKLKEEELKEDFNKITERIINEIDKEDIEDITDEIADKVVKKIMEKLHGLVPYCPPNYPYYPYPYSYPYTGDPVPHYTITGTPDETGP